MRVRRRPLKVSELGWIDGFYRGVRRHLLFREADAVLILPPNRVTKVNEGGAQCLRHLAAGRRIRSLPGLRDGERAAQVHEFFSDLKALYLGECSPGACRSVEEIPYDFGFTRLPILGEVAVTYRCNNSCRFCYAGCGGARPNAATRLPARAAKEMSLAELKRVLRIFRRRARIPFFSFTGGEPLLRPELPRLVRYARSQGLESNLITNGTLLTPGLAATLRRAGLGSAQVSVESHLPEVHDGLTGRPGSHRETLRGIALLQDAGIPVQTNTTLTSATADSITGLPRFLWSLGIRRFAMNLFIPTSSSRGARELFFPYARTPEILEAVRREARRLCMTFYWYSPLPHCHYNPVARGLGNKSCAAMDGLLSVSPSGEVLPCSSYPESLGNILRRPFEEIWFSERARFFKEKRYAPPECSGCPHFTACQAACPLYWMHAGTGEIRNPASLGSSRAAAPATPVAASGRLSRRAASTAATPSGGSLEQGAGP